MKRCGKFVGTELTISLSLSVQTDLEAGVTAALMKVQPSSEPDLAAQHRALQLSVRRKGTELSQNRANTAGSAPTSCEDAANADTDISCHLLRSKQN